MKDAMMSYGITTPPMWHYTIILFAEYKIIIVNVKS